MTSNYRTPFHSRSFFWAVSTALLVLPCSARPNSSFGYDGESDSEVLLQTSQQAGVQQQDGMRLWDKMNKMGMVASPKSQPKDTASSCLQVHEIQLVPHMDSVRMMGFIPSVEACKESDVAAFSQIGYVGTKMPFGISMGRSTSSLVAKCALFAYLAIGAIAVMGIFRSVMMTHPISKGQEEKYPEMVAYQQGIISWLWMGWATGWISRWGNADNSDVTKIHADEIPLADADDGCGPCFKAFEPLWDAEIRRVGVDNASLMKVVSRFITYRKVLFIAGWNALYEGFLFLGPPLAIRWVTSFVAWLFVQRQRGIIITPGELLVPSIFIIVVFTGLPIIMAISNTVSSLLNSRVGIRMGAALSCVVFRKAQRLPMALDTGGTADKFTQVVSGFNDSAAFNDHFKNQKAKEKEAQKKKEEEETAEDPVDWVPVPKRFNVVQLVSNDINVNIMAIPLALARIVVMLPVLVITLSMLLAQVGWAFVFSFGVFVVNMIGMIYIGLLMRVHLALFYNASGLRLQFFQQVMYGIRFIKGFGGEALVRERLEKSRANEVAQLDAYYTTMCWMFFMMLCFPRLYLLASLGGVTLLYGNSLPPESIISIIPLLFSVQGSICVVFSLAPTLIMAMPSAKRLEAFLKQRDAPKILPKTADADEKPAWLTPWPVKDVKTASPMLRVQGSFSWDVGARPVLKDMNIAIPHGSIVAVVGQVGTGKSTLLHAILGELYPSGDARIEVPEKVAFSCQVPHIFEGTLRENILQGEAYDQVRYKETLSAASLLSDLEVLPGYDEVPVGSRGITLSGGQKARVSMARAAYCHNTDVVLIDDPFGSLDMCTGQHILENLVFGPIMNGRTRVIVCLPDSERLQRFDWVLVMKDGGIVAQGRPAEIMDTQEYKNLLCTRQANNLDGESSSSRTGAASHGGALNFGSTVTSGQDNFKLRDEEFEGRASWATIVYFGRMGGWFAIISCVTLYLMKNIFDVLSQTALAAWMNHGIMNRAGIQHKVSAGVYLLNYVFWMGLSYCVWFTCWVGGQKWTISLSKGCHNAIVRALLRAPVDRFYDKTPVGRIMNRMANDMMNVDTQVFVGVCSTIGMTWSLCTPILYVHFVMPLWFSVFSIPFYYLVISLLKLYWKTMVPLRYLMQTSKSSVNDEVAEIETSNASIRAYGKSDYRLRHFQEAMGSMISSDFVGRTILMRWLSNRLFVLGGFFVTCLALLVVWVPGAVDVGRGSLCMMMVFSIIVSVESNVTLGAGAQYQIIAMNRVYEYTSLPDEADEELSTDKTFKNLTIRVPRTALDSLQSREGIDGALVIQRARTKDVLLQQIPSRPAFLAARGKTLADLAPSCKELQGTDAWHRIIAVNGAFKTASDIAEELSFGSSEEVMLHVQSGWLADGVKVEIKNLRAGYADVPRDVLQGVNLTIPRRCKAAVVGTTGCGKSTLLLCLLRLLEPRNGRIYIEGVDTQNLGLRTLRMAIGLVPQDPVLLEGALRYNVDPFGQYTDERIWDALRLVQLEEFVSNCEGGLDFEVTADGSNLSYGQRQLMSLARNILRQPMLLLLDEATSAIDPHTQGLVQNTIGSAFPDSTMIVIAHRLETILDFNMVAVLDQGRVVEKGPVKELSRMKMGLFAKMLAAKGKHGKEFSS